MANTPNLNLEKPLGTDKALVARLNSNSDKLDSWAGTINQALSNVTNAKRMNISSLADFQSQLETLIGTMANEAVVAIHYHPAAAYAPFQDQDYYGNVYRNNANSFTVTLTYRNEVIIGGKQGTEWSWGPLALKSETLEKTTQSFSYTGGAHSLNGFASKIGKNVFFGFFCDINIPDGTVITTLPTGYRPNISIYPQIIFVPDTRGQTKTWLQIGNDGKVTFKNPDSATVWTFFTAMYFNE